MQAGRSLNPPLYKKQPPCIHEDRKPEDFLKVTNFDQNLLEPAALIIPASFNDTCFAFLSIDVDDQATNLLYVFFLFVIIIVTIFSLFVIVVVVVVIITTIIIITFFFFFFLCLN